MGIVSFVWRLFFRFHERSDLFHRFYDNRAQLSREPRKNTHKHMHTLSVIHSKKCESDNTETTLGFFVASASEKATWNFLKGFFDWFFRLVVDGIHFHALITITRHAAFSVLTFIAPISTWLFEETCFALDHLCCTLETQSQLLHSV